MWLLILVSAALCGVQAFDGVVDVFFIRHVESQWNCYSDHGKKADVVTPLGCPPDFNYQDAPISRDGAAQLKEILDTLGAGVFNIENGQTNPLRTALETLEGDSNKIAFMTSNLRRADATAIIARRSLIQAFPSAPPAAGSPPNAVQQVHQALVNADFLVTSQLQEVRGGKDTKTEFPESLKVKKGKFNGAEWSSYLTRDWPTPVAEAAKTDANTLKQLLTPTSEGTDYFSHLVKNALYESSPRRARNTWPAKPKLTAFKNLLHDEATAGKKLFIIGGHSHYFMHWVKHYGASAQMSVDYRKTKLKNGEMVHAKVKLSESVLKNNLEIISVDSIFIPPSLKQQPRIELELPAPDDASDQGQGEGKVVSAAMTQYANMLMREDRTLRQFHYKQLREIERLLRGGF